MLDWTPDLLLVKNEHSIIKWSRIQTKSLQVSSNSDFARRLNILRALHAFSH